MKLAATALIFCVAAAGLAQTDHDNLDKNRPLSFEDAEPIARRGFAYELGLTVSFQRNRRLGFEIPLELIWGAAPDTQLELGTHARFGNRTDFDLSNLELGVLHSFRREVDNSPALALKLEAEAEDGQGRYRVTGIATKTVNQYDRLHLNAGLELAPSAAQDENRSRWGAVVGFTKPIGYPRHFDTTGLAELSLKQAERKGDSPVVGIGIGIRRQMTPRSVLDLGLQSELSGRNRVPLRLILGYSTSL